MLPLWRLNEVLYWTIYKLHFTVGEYQQQPVAQLSLTVTAVDHLCCSIFQQLRRVTVFVQQTESRNSCSNVNNYIVNQQPSGVSWLIRALHLHNTVCWCSMLCVVGADRGSTVSRFPSLNTECIQILPQTQPHSVVWAASCFNVLTFIMLHKDKQQSNPVIKKVFRWSAAFSSCTYVWGTAACCSNQTACPTFIIFSKTWNFKVLHNRIQTQKNVCRLHVNAQRSQAHCYDEFSVLEPVRSD